MEGWRRDDLIRQNRFGEVMTAFSSKYNSNKGKYFNDQGIIYCQYQSEIDKTHGVLTQNPEY